MVSGRSSGDPVVTPGPEAGASASKESFPERFEQRVARHRLRLRGRPLGLLSVRVARRFVEVRVTGLAAEMTYYLILSLVPLVTALGVLTRDVGRGRVTTRSD